MPTSQLMPAYSANQVSDLLKIRVPRDVLKQFRKHPAPNPRRLVVWHPGLSLMEQSRLEAARELIEIPPQLRYYWQFPMRRVAAGYYPVCLPAPGTEDLNAAQQKAVVAGYGEIPSWAAIASWTWLVHFVATGKSLGQGLWLRCRDDVSQSPRTSAGMFVNYHLSVAGLADAAANRHVRLASQAVETLSPRIA